MVALVLTVACVDGQGGGPGGAGDPADGDGSGDSEGTRDTFMDSGDAPPEDSWQPPNEDFEFQRLLLVTLDTLRVDRLSMERTPFLSMLPSQGLFFPNLWGETWTYAGIGQILSARDPAGWGAASWAPTDGKGPPVLGDDVQTLAEAASAAGWATAAFSGNEVAGEVSGLDRGYQSFSAINDGTAALVAEEIAQWAEDHADRLQLAHLHLNDTHVPYDTLGGCSGEVSAVNTGECRYDFVHDARSTDEANADLELGSFGPDAADFEACRALVETAYDCELETMDRALADAFLVLEERRALIGTIVVVASDHGELLLDPGAGHSFDSRAAITRTYGVILAPGLVEPAEVDAPISQADLIPAALALAGVDLGLEGTGMSPAEAPADRVLTSFWVGTTPGGTWRQDHAAVGSGLHYLRRSTGEEALYDLAADPLETTNRLESGDPVPADLLAAVDAAAALTADYGL